MASNWKVETRGFTELQETFKNAPRKIQDVGREWAREVAAEEAALIRREAPRKSGKFRNTIEPYARAFVIGVRFQPYPKLGYKLKDWIIGGTRPHIIRAKNAEALHFYWKRKRKWVFAKFVRHPGTKPNDFVTRGAIKFDPRIEYWLEVLGERITDMLGK